MLVVFIVHAEIDMSNQINNSWSKPTVLAVGQGSLRYSIMMDVPNKNTLKNFIDKTTDVKAQYKQNRNVEKKIKRYRNRCISLCHAYLLHLILSNNLGALSEAKVCQDNIAMYVDRYLALISNHKRSNVKAIRVSFGLQKRNSVQEYAKLVMKGRLKPDYVLNSKDTLEIIELIGKLVPKEKLR